MRPRASRTPNSNSSSSTVKIEITKGSNAVAGFFAQPPSPEGEADRLQLEFADRLTDLMEEKSISRIELARRLGIRPSRVTALLSGEGNLTTLTMVRAALAVGARYHHCVAPEGQSVRWQCWEEATVHPGLRAKAVPLKNAEATFIIPDPDHDDKPAAA